MGELERSPGVLSACITTSLNQNCPMTYQTNIGAGPVRFRNGIEVMVNPLSKEQTVLFSLWSLPRHFKVGRVCVEAASPVWRMRSRDGQESFGIDGRHFRRLNLPICSTVLDDAQRVDPDVAESKLPRQEYRVSKGIGQVLHIDSSLPLLQGVLSCRDDLC